MHTQYAASIELTFNLDLLGQDKAECKIAKLARIGNYPVKTIRSQPDTRNALVLRQLF